MLDLGLRLLLAALGAWSGFVLWRRTGLSTTTVRDRWSIGVGRFVAVPLMCVFVLKHAGVVLHAADIQRESAPYAQFGDPRAALEARASLSGWVLDCTGRDENAWVGYASQSKGLSRAYFAGQAGATFIADPEDRIDYTVERLFSDLTARPRSLGERFESHPVGADLRTTLCRGLTQRAHSALLEYGEPGVVVIGRVSTGAILTYAATHPLQEAPLGVKQYLAPGSVNKLMTAGAWWESGWPDRRMRCPSTVDVGGRPIRNFGGMDLGTLEAPLDVLVRSCNTATVTMAAELRSELGEAPMRTLYEASGFGVYQGVRPSRDDITFWNSDSERWVGRMSPALAQVRLGSETSDHEWGLLSIGQGPIDVTALQVARFMQAIGNNGIMLRPTIEQDLADRPQRVGRLFGSRTAARLREAMSQVVERGTAVSARGFLGDTDGWRLMGKTGTAQVDGRPDDGWFAGLIADPAGEAAYTIVVYLRGGGPGGGAPARLAARLVNDVVAADPGH